MPQDPREMKRIEDTVGHGWRALLGLERGSGASLPWIIAILVGIVGIGAVVTYLNVSAGIEPLPPSAGPQ